MMHLKPCTAFGRTTDSGNQRELEGVSGQQQSSYFGRIRYIKKIHRKKYDNCSVVVYFKLFFPIIGKSLFEVYFVL